MSHFGVQIDGLAQIRSRLERTTHAVEQANVLVLNRVAERTIERIEEGMAASPATGRTYTKSNPRRIHTASSASGKAYPRHDTRELIASLEIDHAVAGSLYSRVGTNLPHAEDLEYGTSKMAPRPFLWRSYRSAIRTVAKELRETYEALR
jgi:hypothetical protein